MSSPQRAYRAACPNCGAPVEFASAASASAVCGFCRSTLLREGEALRRIGTSAELFDDHSPLQRGVRGTRQGLGFTLVGRLQYQYAEGTWSEWHVLFDNGRSAWLSEDNGAYVLAFDAPRPDDAPQLETLRAGQRVRVDGRVWDVASVLRATLAAAEGELPALPRLGLAFPVADLRNSAGEVATLDGSDPETPHWSVGRSVALSELALSGLRETSEKTLSGRSIECPSCGQSLEVKLATTQSIVCTACASVVDVSGGVGADLASYQQNNAGTSGAEPLIPLGRTGRLALDGAGTDWQVVGYLERCDIPVSDEDETSFWREYLLYNATQGFVFLVDTNEGWSWVRPITGAPVVKGEVAEWKGVRYRRRWGYAAKVTWVLGEFFWRVQRDQHAQVTDYEGEGTHADRRLSREATGDEVVWSAGRTIAAETVATAFGLAPERHAVLQRDVKPYVGKTSGATTALLLFFTAFVLLVLLTQCSRDDCDDVRRTFGAASTEYQQCEARSGSGYRGSGGGSGGGSYGGWSGGGGHK